MDNIGVLVGWIFIFYELYFIFRALNRQGGPKAKGFSAGKAECFEFAIVEPWRTKYCWGGIVQVFLILALLYLAVFV